MPKSDIRTICFYLPQYHPIPENDERWGKGFTDWRNVVQARPLFEGHYQPRISADLGFYDLRVKEVQEQQAELARQYDIHGFCYYYYWLGGRKLLDKPLSQVLEGKTPDFPFCVCWANHDWINTWTATPRFHQQGGTDNDVMFKQTYSVEDARAFIESLAPAMRDPRYIRVDGKPLLVIYDTGKLPDAGLYAGIWRDEARKQGVGDIYLARIETFGERLDPGTIGFDASIEFPPHGVKSVGLTKKAIDPSSGFSGTVFDYEQTAFYAVNREMPQYKYFRGVMPSWDNTARRPPAMAKLWHGSTPGAYFRWLQECALWTRSRYAGDERLVFINGWNEWAESAYLEPDLRWGHAYLEATRNAIDPHYAFADPEKTNIRAADFALQNGVLSNLSSLGKQESANGFVLRQSGEIAGNIEKVWSDSGKVLIAGWACDKSEPRAATMLLVFSGARLIARERSFIERPDVAAAVSPQATRAGFHIEIDETLLRKDDCASSTLVMVSVSGAYNTLKLKLPAPVAHR